MEINFDYKSKIKYSSKDSIYLFKNAMDNKLCDDIISFFLKKEKEKIHNTSYYENKIINSYHYTLNNPNEDSCPEENELDDKIFKIINKYFTFLNSITFSKINSDEGYTINKIYDSIPIHTNDFISSNIIEKKTSIRSLCAIFYLNNDDNILKFPRQNLKINLKKGDLICFPPYWTHPYSLTYPKNNPHCFTINTYSIEEIIN